MRALSQNYYFWVCVCVMDMTKVSRKCSFSYFRLRKLAAILILLDLEFLIKFWSVIFKNENISSGFLLVF